MRSSPAPKCPKARPDCANRGVAWPRGSREAGLALSIALGVMLGLAYWAPGAFRDLETASLDLRFRIRGALPARAGDCCRPGRRGQPLPARPLAAEPPPLCQGGRDPRSRRRPRHRFRPAVCRDRKSRSPRSLREAARAAAERLREPEDAALRSTLARIAEDEPDADFAGALRASGKVLLPVAFPSFDGGVEEAPLLAEHVYQRLDPSTNAPLFPLQPASALLPIPPLSEAAAGLGHVMVAFDRDGAPRYDYLAVPFDAEFVPSLPVRAAAAYLGLRWSEVGLALGDGVKLGDIFIPTDPAMRLVDQLSRPARARSRPTRSRHWSKASSTRRGSRTGSC